MWEGLKAWLTSSNSATAQYYFEFNAPVGTAVSVILIVIAGVAASFLYWPTLKRLSLPVRVMLVAFRTMAVVLVLFLLLDPCIVKRHIQPGEYYVAVLIDDSKSMQIRDAAGAPRGESLLSAYEAHRLEFEDVLRSKFQVAMYAFGETTERIAHVNSLNFLQRESNVVRSVQDVLADLEGTKLAGVVVLSDGVNQPGDGEIPSALRNADVPVYTVGVGESGSSRDLRIAKISVRRTEFDKSPVSLTVHVKAAGLAREQAVVEVLKGPKVVKSKVITLQTPDEDQLVTLDFIPAEKSWIEYAARVRLAETGPRERADAVSEITVPDKDPIGANNEARFAVDNREKSYRILYLSGRPNWEFKFFRRAITYDNQIKLTSLIRIHGGEQKFEFKGRQTSLSNPLFEGFEGQDVEPRYDEAVFLRLGIENESDLVTGYPQHPEDLFPYHLVIWNSIEHNHFSNQQLELTREFVEKRGGSILFLGGASSFAEGNYTGTMIENMIPVVLRRSAGDTRDLVDTTFTVKPTVEGELSGMWKLDPADELSRRIWETMPELRGINVFPLTRAGASVLARVESVDPELDGRPLFVVQPYGEGKSAVLGTGETWQWQMQRELEDQTQERLWRQIVRSLVSDVPTAVYLRNKQDTYTVAAEAPLEFIVRDNLFDPREELTTTLEIVPPSGIPISLPVDESIREAGLYTAEFLAEEPGMHRIKLSAVDAKGETVGALDEALLAAPDQREFQRVRSNADLLKSLAKETGGRYFELEQLSNVAGAVPWVRSENEEVVRYHLWHFPPFFFIIVLLLSAEWALRRIRGRA